MLRYWHRSVPQTSPAQPPQPITLVRHIVPVVAGGIVTLLLTLVTDNSLRAHQVLPSPDSPVFETGPLLLIAGYRGLFAILGCHLAARMAPARPASHPLRLRSPWARCCWR